MDNNNQVSKTVVLASENNNQGNKAVIIILIVLLILTLLITTGYYIKSNSSDSKPTLLSVVGEGKVKANPELAQFTISYVSTATSSAETLTSEKKLRQSIISLLTDSFAVLPSDIQVSYPNLSPVAISTGIAYQAVNTLNINFNKLSSLDEAIAKLYELKNLSVTNVILTTNNSRDLEDQAITQAVIDGSTRAQKMAQASGKKLGKLVSVSGQQTQAVGTLTTQAGNSPRTTTGGTTLTALGPFELTRNVSLVYELN